jgi:hypothetical protein
MRKILEMAIFVIIGLSILFGFYTIKIYGDMIDIVFYTFFIICSSILSALIYKRNKLFILIIEIINITCVSSLNKINGFPDKELKNIVAITAFFAMDVILISFFIKNKNKCTAVLMFFILNCKIFQLPTDVTRQLIFADRINLEGFENRNINFELITKTDENKLFIIGNHNGNGIVMVFTKSSNNGLYEFEKEYWLIDGKGSMDVQIPNYQFWEKAVLIKIFNYSIRKNENVNRVVA